MICMTTEVLFKFAKKDINLSPEAYKKIISLDNPLDFSSSLIVKLKSQEFSKDDLISLDENVVDDFIVTLGLSTHELDNKKNQIASKNQSTLFSDDNRNDDDIVSSDEDITLNDSDDKGLNLNDSDDKVLNADTAEITTTSDVKVKNLDTENVANRIATEPIFNPSIDANSTTDDIENKDKVDANVLDSFEETQSKPISKIVQDKVPKVIDASKFKRNLNPPTVEYDFEILQDTSKKSYTSGEIGNLITYFKNRYEKLSNILSKRPELRAYQKIRDLDEKATDLTLIVMVSEIRNTKNGHRIVIFEDDTDEIAVLFHKDNHELFRASEKLIKDETVGILAERKGELAIANRIIQPGIPRVPKKDMNFSAVFTSDIHIGSLTFLEDAFVRFTKWLNGDFGSEEQKEIANDVKYMVVGGDIVDGIGVYPNQDAELAIKDISDQYDEAARLLGDIRSDIKIIITPGNHDASRVAEPQPAVPEKYAKHLYELNNTEFISNPGVVSLDGWNTLIYHGRGFDDIAIGVKGFSHEHNDVIMEELLNMRHLAPIYGERTPLASELEDYLVIDNVPDIFHTGHVHINTYRNYNGVHMINSGTFQTQTEFQKIHNIVPTCANVPVLHRGTYKQLNFLSK